MALNSAVTENGGEIGRAQALQALACKLKPHTDMNPILLKPSSDTGAQVIVHGHAIDNMQASAYHDYKKVALQAILESHTRLSQQYEKIIVEGAGSPAEINLREGDVANMGFAEAVDCPVILLPISIEVAYLHTWLAPWSYYHKANKIVLLVLSLIAFAAI